MSRKMDIPMSKSTNKHKYPPLLPKKNNAEVRMDHFCPRLKNIDQGGGRGGAMAVPNPRKRHAVGEKINCKLPDTFCPRL